MRKTVGVLILLAWFASLAWLLLRTGSVAREDIARGRDLAPFAGFYRVDLGETQVGFGSATADTAASAFRITGLLALDVADDGAPWRVGYRSEGIYDRGLTLQSFDRTVSLGGISIRYHTEADSGGAGLTLRWASPMDAELGSELRVSSTTPTFLERGLPYWIASTGRMAIGQSMPILIYDPVDAGFRLDRITVAAESTFVLPDSAVLQGNRWRAATTLTVHAWRVDHAPNGLPQSTWVDDRGNLVLLRHRFGLSWQRTAFDIARENYRLDEANRTLVPPAGSRPWAGSGIAALPGDSLRLLVGGSEGFPLPARELEFLAGGRQRVDHGYLVITRETPPAAQGEATVGYSVQYMREEGDTSVDLQSRRVGGQETDRIRLAERMARWVSSTIRLDTALDAPLQPAAVLRARRAGSDGKARLLAAMLRVHDIPARVVTGVVMTEAGLLGHAWVEVWTDRWVPADPHTGTIPASTGFVRMREGGRSRPVDLVPLLGALRLAPSLGPEDS